MKTNAVEETRWIFLNRIRHGRRFGLSVFSRLFFEKWLTRGRLTGLSLCVGVWERVIVNISSSLIFFSRVRSFVRWLIFENRQIQFVSFYLHRAHPVSSKRNRFIATARILFEKCQSVSKTLGKRSTARLQRVLLQVLIILWWIIITISPRYRQHRPVPRHQTLRWAPLELVPVHRCPWPRRMSCEASWRKSWQHHRWALASVRAFRLLHQRLLLDCSMNWTIYHRPDWILILVIRHRYCADLVPVVHLRRPI